MKKYILTILTVLSFIYISSAQFQTKWNNGVTIESSDKQFKTKFGGRIMYDLVYINQSDSLNTQYGKQNLTAEFRRVRIFNSGTLYGNTKYKLNIGFANGNISFKDVFLEFTNIPMLGKLRAGHFKEPLRLNVLTSSKFITFMERPNLTAFSKERSTGIMLHNTFHNELLAFQIGVFGVAGNNGNDNAFNNHIRISGRLTSKINLNNNNHNFLHLGVSASIQKNKEGEYKVKARPSNHISPKYISTEIISHVSEIDILNLEAAWVLGPFSLQAEFLADIVNASKNYHFSSYYAQASYFITGEHRPYKNSYAGFGRLKPHKNLGNSIDGNQGFGALEVAIRYNSINVQDQDINGGTMNDITLGLNWYLNPVSRIMLNYTFGTTNQENESFNILQTRFQIDF